MKFIRSFVDGENIAFDIIFRGRISVRGYYFFFIVLRVPVFPAGQVISRSDEHRQRQ